MGNLLLVFCCLVIGALLRRTRAMPEETPRVMAGLVVRVALPAVTLSALHALPVPKEGVLPWVLPASMPWIMFVGSALMLRPIARALRWPTATYGAIALTAGFCNTSFVGFPILEALLGKGVLGVGAIVDQLGSFLCVSTLGLVFAAAHSDGQAEGRSVTAAVIAKRVLTFPAFIAMGVAFATRSIAYPPALQLVLDRLGGMLVPLAVLYVGLHLHFDRAALRKHGQPLLVGLAWRLVVAPALYAFVVVRVLHLRGAVPLITLLEAAMSPMITAAVLAAEYDVEPELANLMVGVGVPLSLLTVPAWHALLRGLV